MIINKLGIDIGSTTAKVVLTNAGGDILHYGYVKHHANILKTLNSLLTKTLTVLGDQNLQIAVTGSAGMGISERFNLPFVQEVVASAILIEKRFPDTKTLIDIGGEDAKMIYFSQGKAPDMRMNGSCAGGTGAFIEQMSSMLGIELGELSNFAIQGEHVYPIASRCGVFSKTDIQNLVARGVNKADIALSIFHAVALQIISSLSRGVDIKPKVFMCGGPFAFIPALSQAFAHQLNLSTSDYTVNENAAIIPAWGTALQLNNSSKYTLLSDFIKNLEAPGKKIKVNLANRLAPLFEDEESFLEWKLEKSQHFISREVLKSGKEYTGFLGIDSGSTTTKITLIDSADRLLYSFYAQNQGNSLDTLLEGLKLFQNLVSEIGCHVDIIGSCATGYGEDLIKTTLGLDYGIVETIAHYMAAYKINPKVSFILDIGGQDMKAIFVENGAITRLEVNEACSSGCGSFIEAFANTLNYEVVDFAEKACTAKQPCDLGTRCTVFMNSKVKQYLREGASIEDIAAGLSYSVAKNCLNKVLKIKNMDELGDCIVVQGGTMRNRSVVKAFEIVTGKELLFTDIPELMGAFGASLYAKKRTFGANHQGKTRSIHSLTNTSLLDPEMVSCTGCENQCMVRKFSFENGTAYYSGNKCEKIFNNKGTDQVKGADLHQFKYEMLFGKQPPQNQKQNLTIGIPRILNMYENFPFWNALLSGCGFNVLLSHRSTYKQYENGISTVMSDNICFPAKLVHGHIFDLANRKVDRLFMPYVVFEKKDENTVDNSYNCPIVSGYSDVIKCAIDTVSRFGIPIDAPTIVFNDDKLLKAACFNYLKSLNIKKSVFENAFKDAISAQQGYAESLYHKAQEIVAKAADTNRIVILLAGHPYHNDPLIQHKVSEIIGSMGADVITEDIVRFNDATQYHDVHAVLQWTYTNRIIKAAKWVIGQPANVHFVQITSFGCGPDAFIIDETTEILRRNHRPYTQLKVDDINNAGSLRLRIRSLIESLKFKSTINKVEMANAKKNRIFTEDDKNKLIIGPFFSEYYSPFLPPLLKHLGYHMINLPPGNQQSIELGLQYSNNEVCYPATLIIGDILQALRSGNYNLDNTAVMFAQTGGQCRATNYISILKKAMINAGYADIPVVAMGFGSSVINDQPGFKLNWNKNIGLALKALLFADCISQMYYATVVREKVKGQSAILRDFYIGKAVEAIEVRNPKRLFALLEDAAEQFNGLAAEINNIPKIGIVGEIYLKHNAFSNRNLYQWLIEQGVEVMAPSLANFFLQYFVNSKVNKEKLIERSSLSPLIADLLHQLVKRLYHKMDKASAKFRYYKPFANIYDEARHASQIVNLAAQFGEGWLIPAEISSFAQIGVDGVICLQPFGCISNHVVGKGIAKKVAALHPNLNLLFLDFDGGTSEVNILNRLHFVIQNISKKTPAVEVSF